MAVASSHHDGRNEAQQQSSAAGHAIEATINNASPPERLVLVVSRPAPDRSKPTDDRATDIAYGFVRVIFAIFALWISVAGSAVLWRLIS